MTSDNGNTVDAILAAVHTAGVSSGLHRDITDPEEIMHRREAFIEANPVCKDAIALLDTYYATKFLELLGEDYVFERPQDDYLPNVYQFLKGKNELRAELRAKIKEALLNE